MTRKRISRREFLKGAIGLIAAGGSLPLLAACSPAPSTDTTTGLTTPAANPSPEPPQSTLAPPATTALPEPGQTSEATSAAENSLVVDGLVITPLNLSYEAILSYPAVTQAATLYCPGVYENQPSRDWYGIPIGFILKDADVKPEATKLIFYAPDGYMTTLSIDRVVNSGAILAYKVDGLPLTPAGGYPFRLLCNQIDSPSWIKRITRIEVAR